MPVMCLTGYTLPLSLVIFIKLTVVHTVWRSAAEEQYCLTFFHNPQCVFYWFDERCSDEMKITTLKWLFSSQTFQSFLKIIFKHPLYLQLCVPLLILFIFFACSQKIIFWASQTHSIHLFLQLTWICANLGSPASKGPVCPHQTRCEPD